VPELTCQVSDTIACDAVSGLLVVDLNLTAALAGLVTVDSPAAAGLVVIVREAEYAE
jgi:hypothetical protein